MTIDDRINDRIGALVEKGLMVLATDSEPEYAGLSASLDWQQYSNWRNQSLSFLSAVLGRDHVYTRNFDLDTERGAFAGCAQNGMGILEAVQEDIRLGHIETVRQLIRAEVLSDLFDQAGHLLENGYKIPAASLAGAALENGLRSIANTSKVQVKENDNLQSLNQKIADQNIYSRLVQKKVSFWIDIRNHADHGHFESLDDGDVEQFIQGAQAFLADYS